MIKQVSQN